MKRSKGAFKPRNGQCNMQEYDPLIEWSNQEADTPQFGRSSG